MKTNVAIVIPSWNAADSIGDTLVSLEQQTLESQIIVVDNGSVDNSVELIKAKFPGVILLEQSKNLGFAGGVNVGIRYAMEQGVDFVALFNNDAIASKQWLQNLVDVISAKPEVGIVTGKLLDSTGARIDSTGDFYTVWGLPFPRGRDEPNSDKYDKQNEIFAASGGASLYRIEMFKQIGLFDEKFFAYYEDIDLSFRAQLAGWQVNYVPTAIAYHQIGATSSKIKGFTTYQSLKNLPILMRKNLPLSLAPKVVPRLWLAYTGFFFKSLSRGQTVPAFKGVIMSIVYLPHAISERWKIQKNRKVSVDYIKGMLVYDLPPGATELRNLRAKWWRLTRRNLNG